MLWQEGCHIPAQRLGTSLVRLCEEAMHSQSCLLSLGDMAHSKMNRGKCTLSQLPHRYNTLKRNTNLSQLFFCLLVIVFFVCLFLSTSSSEKESKTSNII